MSPAVHFLVSILMAFALELEFKRKYLVIFSLGLVGMLPDLDHLIIRTEGVGLFHNLLVLGVLPLVLLILVNNKETSQGMHSSRYQRYVIAAGIILIGHLILDAIAGNGFYLGLAASTQFHAVPVGLISSVRYGVLLYTTDLLWATLIILVLSGNVCIKKINMLYEGFDNEEPLPEMDAELAHYRPTGAI